jgi:hypothetical protein
MHHRLTQIVLLLISTFSADVLAVQPWQILKHKPFHGDQHPALARKHGKPHVNTSIRSDGDGSVVLLAKHSKMHLSGGASEKTSLQVLKSPAVLFYLIFAIASVLVLNTPVGSLGNRIFGLVIGYNVALVTVASKNGYQDWLDLYKFLVPVSFLQVLPDVFQADYQNVLVYPDTGGPFIGPVSAAMAAGLWTIPLFALTLLGRYADQKKGRKKDGYAAVALSGLIVFGVAEGQAWRIPIWETKNCKQLGKMAYFSLAADMVLGLLVYAFSPVVTSYSFLLRLVVAVLMMLTFTGTASIAYLFTDIIPRRLYCDST